ncbi:hypothetical protein DFA_06963 [Cavenderia fasciculata]|uniref:Uncharacterized protein n=1 Tax=Cavenderia fasciculata TaxID=261658 RepID=F4PX57_CACFS|nr:uncharacterized protein DFA_06963 [Cavenderia fasciculata]EGG19860.1 hypothetical protein DFA_06963 [Cavenderia fasciculata]|eukprot:XP_004358206.1 hypothetical protein DFA_06963 [Cavenderia fasciculata]
MGGTGSLGIATVSKTGQLVKDPYYVGPIGTTYEWYTTSYQYESGRDSVYLVVSGPQIFVYDFENSKTDDLDLSMNGRYNIPSGCFDGHNNYYFMEINDDDYSQFTLSSYSFADEQQSDNVNVTGISANSDTYLYCSNKQVYALAYDTINPTNMSLYLIDTNQD